MGVIGEVVEGIINGIYSIYKKRNNKEKNWEKLHPNQVPNWVERSAHKFIKRCKGKHHDLRKDFKGNNYLYRVYFRHVSHKRIKEEYWRKKIKR